MRQGRKRRVRLLLLLALAVVAVLGARWAIYRAYPFSYQSIVLSRAAEYELDPYLVAAVIRTESRFRRDAVSKQGARGLMQIMPETGQWAAERLGIPYSPDLLFDPDYNIRLGCWYLADLRREFGGEMTLALAAYNGGRTNVAKWLRDKQWTGEHTTLAQIPFPETRTYVARVRRDIERYRLLYDREGSR